MKLVDALLLYGAAGFFLIALLQAMATSFQDSYFLFMISIMLIAIYQYRNPRTSAENKQKDAPLKPVSKKRKK